MSTWYLGVDATPGGCTKYWNEMKYDVIWSCTGGCIKYWNEIKYDVIWSCSFWFLGY